MRTIRVFATAVAIPVLLSACGSGSSDGGSSPLPTAGGGFTGGGETFFNDTDGIKFADALGGSFTDVFAAIFSGLNAGGTASSDTSITQRMKRATQSDSLQCSGGGSITNTTSVNDSTGEISSVSMSFNNCVSDGNRANGSIAFSISGTESNQTVTLNFNNFVSVENGEGSSINGAVTINAAQSGSQVSTTISGSQITMVSAGETVSISNYSLSADIDDASGAASVSGGATIATSSDGTVTMLISPALTTSDNDDYPTSGAMSYSHSDGSSLSINADTGNASTFSYVISDGSTTTSGVGNWAETDIGEFSL